MLNHKTFSLLKEIQILKSENFLFFLLTILRVFLKDKDVRHALIASGSAGGLAAAFNAPLAGIMFVIEEMRPQFRYSFISIKGVTISVVVAVIVLNYFRGPSAEIIIPDNITPPVQSLWLFLLLCCRLHQTCALEE